MCSEFATVSKALEMANWGAKRRFTRMEKGENLGTQQLAHHLRLLIGPGDRLARV
jgi:hypothetical protein